MPAADPRRAAKRLLPLLLLALALPAPSAQAATFNPVADAHTRSDHPRRNYGTLATLRADGSPVTRSYLRFNVAGLERSVAKATLWLYTRSASTNSGIQLRSVSTNSWTETGITYRNAPSIGSSVSSTAAFKSGQWVALDATRLVAGNGTISLAVTTGSDSSRAVAAREDRAYAPRLVVDQVEPPPPPPEPEPDPNPTPDGGTPPPDPTPEPDPTPDTPPTVQLRGAQTHPLWSNSSVADFDRELDLLRNAGATTVRIDIAWSSLEYAGKGIYSNSFTTKIDTFMAHAAARGLKVIVNVHSTPCWASTAPADIKQDCVGAYWDRGVTAYPPADMADYARSTAWIAQRWGSYLAALEIWNEPNEANQVFLKSPDPAATYAHMLKTAYPVVKQAAPTLTVLGGSTSFADGAFIQRLYSLGIKGYHDGLAIHPYNENRDPDDPRTPGLEKWTYKTGVPWIRSIMVANGDGDKGLWLTELGWSTCNVTTSKWCVTESKQAEYTADAIRIARSWDYVKAVVIYNLRNKGTDLADREAQFGLVNRDFSPKPGYQALKDELAR